MSEIVATREAFLKPVELKTCEINTRIGLIRMREVAADVYSRDFQDWMRPDGKLDKERDAVKFSKLVTLSVVDENGKTYLTDEDVAAIETMPMGVQNQLHLAAIRLNGLDAIEGDTLGKSEG